MHLSGSMGMYLSGSVGVSLPASGLISCARELFTRISNKKLNTNAVSFFIRVILFNFVECLIVRKTGLEPVHQLRHYPLKIACLPNSTTSAKLQGIKIFKHYLKINTSFQYYLFLDGSNCLKLILISIFSPLEHSSF